MNLENQDNLINSNNTCDDRENALCINKIQIHKGGFVELLDTFGDDLTVANAARVSFHKESKELSIQDEKLIKYLATHDHITPFFHILARFRIKMPIFVAREWFRHTVGFSRNEVSRRYVDEPPECYVPDKIRARDKNIKQGSKEESVDNEDIIQAEISEFNDIACGFYQSLLDRQVAPEIARTILPQGMYTEFIETASIAGYARLCCLRTDKSAQVEIQDYAKAVILLLKNKFPVSWSALIKNI